MVVQQFEIWLFETARYCGNLALHEYKLMLYMAEESIPILPSALH